MIYVVEVSVTLSAGKELPVVVVFVCVFAEAVGSLPVVGRVPWRPVTSGAIGCDPVKAVLGRIITRTTNQAAAH